MAARSLLHFVVITSVGDTVVYEASHPSPLPEPVQLDVEFFLHASLDTLDLLCRERPDYFFPVFETSDARAVSAYCPIGPYRLLLVVEPTAMLKGPDVKAFFVGCAKILGDSLRNPMAAIHAKIQSQSVRDALRMSLERLHRATVS